MGRLIDAHSEIKLCAPADKLYNHAILCQTGLPYRNPGDNVRHWSRSNGKATLRLEAGHALTTPGSDEWTAVGLPYGPRARLVLIHLTTYALVHQTPIVEVEDSMTAFAKRVGIATSGRNLRTLRAQLGRLAACSIRVGYLGADKTEVAHTALFSRCEVWFPKHARQRVLWPSVVQFSADFYESLQRHAVPLDPRAISALKHSCRSLDIYCWLAQRLWRVNGSGQLVPWRALREQFAHRKKHMSAFKREFKTALTQVVAVYPTAKIELEDAGLLIARSAPPIPGSTSGMRLRGGWGDHRQTG